MLRRTRHAFTTLGTSTFPLHAPLHPSAGRRLAFALLAASTAGAVLPTPARATRVFIVDDGQTFSLAIGDSRNDQSVTIGLDGAGTYNLSGSQTATNDLTVGRDVGSSGILNLLGPGLLTVSGAARAIIGDDGTGTLNQSGADSVASFGARLFLGSSNGARGTYNLSAGSLTAPGLGLGGTSSFTQSGGSATFAGSGVGLSSTTVARGTVNLDGGSLATATVVGGPGTSTFNFNGGTLRATAASTNFFSGVTNAPVRAGGARVDTDGFDVTVSSALTHDASLGAIRDGGLTKSGAGTLTLPAVSTFTGPAVVAAGTLTLTANGDGLANSALVRVECGAALNRINPDGEARSVAIGSWQTYVVNGTLTASGVDVNGGATLAGRGTVSQADVLVCGTLAPGDGGIGRLSLGGSVRLRAGSTLALELGGSTPDAYDQLLSGTSLDLSGRLDVRALNGFALASAQTFDILLNASGSASTNLAFANAPAGLYTDAAGDTFLVGLVSADGGLVPNDVRLTVLTVAGAVPEPGTWALLLIDGAGLVAAGRSQACRGRGHAA